MKTIDPLLVLEAIQAEENYLNAKRALSAHVLDAHGWEVGDEVGIKGEPGIWIIQRATVGFSKKAGSHHMNAKVAVLPKGKTTAIVSYFDFAQVL